MKKQGYILILILTLIVILFGFNFKKNITPNTYYQVYLDGKVLGTIKSKEKLENYINQQGKLIKNQVIEYQTIMNIINDTNSIIENLVSEDINNLKNYTNVLENLLVMLDEKGNYLTDKSEIEQLLSSVDYNIKFEDKKIKNYNELIDYLNSKIKTLNQNIFSNIDKTLLNENQLYSLEEYIKNKYYDINYSKIKYMNDYIEEYEIYTYVDNVYKPLGINIEKINTYKNDAVSEKEIYEKIVSLKPCTIEGYQFRIKRQAGHNIDNNAMFGALGTTNYNDVLSAVSNDIIIYVTDKEIFDEAVETFIGVFVGKEEYETYKNNNQNEITSTGTIIEDMYIQEDITIKQTNISVKEKIYTDAADLSSYLLYGNDAQLTKAYASATDTISSFAYKNQISVEEFFLFNREFNSINNMFYDGQEVVIAKLNPQINLVVDEYSVVDKETNYDTIEKYNSSLSLGSRIVVQNGTNGVERVSQNVTKVNGTISYVEPISKETILGSTSEIVEIGTKVIAHVGSTGSWYWPTNPGYTLSSYFGYRMAVFGEGDFHTGLDIAGTGIGSPVYAANNGTIMVKTYTYSYGNYIMINHNNGYYTLYGHMNGFAPGVEVGQTVARGQLIGYVGQTGWATGPHLHFEIRYCERYACVDDPLKYY